MSYTTLLIPLTSLVILEEILLRTSVGKIYLIQKVAFSTRNIGGNVVAQNSPICSHKVFRLYGSESDDLLICPSVAHNTHGLDGK